MFITYTIAIVDLHFGSKLYPSRKLKCEKLTDDGCEVMAKAHIAFAKVS
jgi:hypothetical protein